VGKTIINNNKHYGNSLYNLFVVIWGMVCYCVTCIIDRLNGDQYFCKPNKLVSSALAQVETVACFNVELFVKSINRRLGNPCPLILRQDPTVSPELEMMMMMIATMVNCSMGL
jgi:hypothetical protein